MLKYLEQPPPRELAPHVECFWAVSDPRSRADRPPERVVPDGCPELIVHLGDPFARRIAGRWVKQPRAFLAGTLTRPWLLRAGRRVDTMSVRFRAGEATAVFPLAMSEAADREVPLFRLVGRPAATALLGGLRDAATAGGRFAAASKWLRSRLAAAPPRRGGAGPAVDAIRTSRGQARIEDLSRSLGWSRRRLERAFARDLGIPPKLYARIVRLNAVLATLDEGERAAAVDLALEAGYFDQAHLLRDFRILAGRAPRAGRLSDGEMARHFTHPERLRALLAGE
jgi:AraC-like DNA-binding protein